MPMVISTMAIGKMISDMVCRTCDVKSWIVYHLNFGPLGQGRFVSYSAGPTVIYEGSWFEGVKVWFQPLLTILFSNRCRH
jgi:hypothetical protein